jgi:hypothetical protein
MATDEQSAPRKKAPYEKPLLHQVPLRPEEAVLGACKTVGSSGPVSGSCSMPVSCSSIGS